VADIVVDLVAVVVAVTHNEPLVLVTDAESERPMLARGALDPSADPTLELALRRWVRRQTGLEVGYVEQLYTFGDVGRGYAGSSVHRELSIAYLALIGEQEPAAGAAWLSWYDLFPWEDRRAQDSVFDADLAAALTAWSEADPADRALRAQVAFGLGGAAWDPVRVLERYELMFEAGLVAESPIAGPVQAESHAMGSDHRRIAATAFGRLRGKLTYRPVVFELLSESFTLRQLQHVVEALSGTTLHTQNFRRFIEKGGLVEGTGASASTGGRPAELFRFRREVLLERPRPGVHLPRR
jgi:hypothetical protein